MSDLTYYQVLGVPTDATTEDIKKAHRKAMRALHPDMGGEATAGMAVLVNQAKDVLTNDVKRIDYNKKIGVNRHSQPQPGAPTPSNTVPTNRTEPPFQRPSASPQPSSPHPEPTPTFTQTEPESKQTTETTVQIGPREIKWWVGVIAVLIMFTALWLATSIAVPWASPFASDPGVLAGIGVVAAVAISIYCWKTGSFPVSTGLLAVLVVIGYAGYQIYRTDPLPHPLIIAAVALLSVVGIGTDIVFILCLRDMHGRSYPGVQIMPEELVRNSWAFGHPQDQNIEELVMRLGAIDGVRLFHRVQLSTGVVAETLAYCNGKLLMIEFIAPNAATLSWNGPTLMERGSGYPRTLTTPPLNQVNARALGCKTFDVLIITPLGVRAPGQNPAHVDVVPVSSLVATVESWAGAERRLNRKTMARIWGSVIQD